PVRELADVLAHAHARGVTHRALTLRSVMFATGDRLAPVSVLDWGLPVDDIGIFGAPERGSADADGRADVFALGVIAFRALTRRFPGEGARETMPGVPAGLAL